jgi:hypothetical protein
MSAPSMAMSRPVPLGVTRPAQSALDPRVIGLLRCAGGPVGLNLLLLFGHEPTACDSAQGFAHRIHCRAADVDEALQGLARAGIVRTSQRPGDATRTSYWLSGDVELFAVLGQIVRTYSSGPEGRHLLFRALTA